MKERRVMIAENKYDTTTFLLILPLCLNRGYYSRDELILQ